MKKLNYLLLAIPVSLGLEYFHVNQTLLFFVACLAIIPLSGILGDATEEIALTAGPRVGGLLNATFGNATELIITIFAIKAGLFDVVKASITGSILSNILLVFGFSALTGGLKYKVQRFNSKVADMNATMLFLSVIALVIPALFSYTHRTPGIKLEYLSIGIAVVLMLSYICGFIFSFFTHKDIFDAPETKETAQPRWSMAKSIIILFITTIFIALESELLVGSIGAVVKNLGLSTMFIGVIIIPIIGNAAEHFSAVTMAIKNKLEISIEIAVGSSIQIALFVAPLLVFISLLFGNPMNFVFTGPEIVSIVLAIFIGILIALDGESNWFEGVQLLGTYIIIALAFLFIF